MLLLCSGPSNWTRILNLKHMEKQRIALEGVLEMVESEVSKVAARAFAQIGEAEAKVALYDSIRIKSSDKSTLEAMLMDTMSEL